MTPQRSAIQGPDLAADDSSTATDDSSTPCASCADKDDIIEGLKRVNDQLGRALHSERIYMRRLEDDNAAR